MKNKEAIEPLIFHQDHLETSANYVCSREQVKAILGRKQGTYKQDTPLLGDSDHNDRTTYRVGRRKDGSIKIGCKEFTKKQVAEIRKWLLRTKGKE